MTRAISDHKCQVQAKVYGHMHNYLLQPSIKSTKEVILLTIQMPPTFFCQRGWPQLCEHVDSLTEVLVVTAAFASSQMHEKAS